MSEPTPVEPTPGEPTLDARYEEVSGRVADAARRAGANPDQVYLIAVTKHAEP